MNEDLISTAQEYFEKLFPVWQKLGDLILIVHSSGEIIFANQACLDSLKITLVEIQSMPVDELLPEWSDLFNDLSNSEVPSQLILNLTNPVNKRFVTLQFLQRFVYEENESFLFHQKIETTLKSSSRKNGDIYKKVINNFKDPFLLWHKKNDSIILEFFNSAAEDLFQKAFRARQKLSLDEFFSDRPDIIQLTCDAFVLGNSISQKLFFKSENSEQGKWFQIDFINMSDGYLLNLYSDISDLKQNTIRLVEQKRQLGSFLRNLPGMAYRCRNDKDWSMEFVSEGSVDLLGYYPSELIENSIISYGDLIHPDDRDDVWDQVQVKLFEKSSFQIIYRVTTADKQIKSVWEKGQAIYSQDGEVEVIEGFITDITERVAFEKKAEKARIQAEALQEAMAELSSQLELSQVLRRILVSLKKILEYNSATLFLKTDNQLKVVAARGFKNTSRLIDKTLPADNRLLDEIQRTEKPIILEDAQKDPRFEHWEGANSVKGWLGVPLIRRGQFIGFMTIDSYTVGAYHTEDAIIAQTFADEAAIMIENARLYEKAQELATLDGLTSIHNRRYFFEAASKEFERTIRYESSLSVIMIDIDHFKIINDRYGHAAGDKLLIQFVRRVKEQLRNIDILARYGGEEFAVLLPETGLEQARQAAERIREVIAFQPFDLTDAEPYITISLGVASNSPDVTNFDELIDHSDKAMYEAKKFGRNRVRVFDQNMK